MLLIKGQWLNGIYQVKPTWWVDVAFKQSFRKNNFDLGLGFSDIFRPWKLAGES